MARTVLAAVLVVLSLVSPARTEDHAAIAVIVHPSRGGTLSSELLGQIYLRRKRFWDDGTPIVPLNLAAGTPMRALFTAAVLRQSDARLADYWNRQYFYGIVPPATLASTEAVRRYVAGDPNALGYVPAAEVDDSVRVILRLE
jgi:ABC-type phosphate transport system substrate-binding protein